MKNLHYYLIILLGLYVLSPVNAQSKFGLGVKAGVNVSTQITTGEGLNVNVDNLMRLHGGIYGNIFLLNKLAIQPELILSGKGSYWNDPFFDDTKDLLTYIDIPVLLRFQPVKLLNIHAGPQFGYLISAMQEDVESSEKMKINEYYRNAELGFVIGVEGNLPFGINVTVRYIHGLSTVTAEDGEYIDPWKNQVFQVSLGYRILGK